MKLIIDIPEEDYKFIKDLQFYYSGRRSGKTIERNVINGIRNGTPLPKGNGGLIDAVRRQDVLDLIADYDLSIGQVVRGIHALPPVIPQLYKADKESVNLCDDCKLADNCIASLKGLTGCKTTKCFRREWAETEEEK